MPTTDGNYGNWDLGLGTALWRGFYSCLVFAKGEHKLLMNLDGKPQHYERNTHLEKYYRCSHFSSKTCSVFEKTTVSGLSL